MLEPVSRWWGVALGGLREGCEPLGCAGKYQDLGPQSVLTGIQAAPVWKGGAPLRTSMGWETGGNLAEPWGLLPWT